MKRRVLVTGASGGLGGAIARQLATDGFELTLHFRRNRRAAQSALTSKQKTRSRARFISFDTTDRDNARRALEGEIKKAGAFWGVVCSSGVIADGPFPAMSGDHWDRVLRTNLDAFYNVLHPLIMPMIHLKDGGRIVTISSLSGVAGNRGQVNYSAAEAGIIGATKALSKELAKRQITVNSVAPGLIETDIVTPEVRAFLLPNIPMQRFGRPEEVAATAGFLFSKGAAYMTGQVLSVNGGIL
jgi:3-oxoacyl-[acyl-carrier protein] reductase